MTAGWEDRAAAEVERLADAVAAMRQNLQTVLDATTATTQAAGEPPALVDVEYHVVYGIERGDRFDVDEAVMTFRKPPVHRLAGADLGRIRASVVKERGGGLVTANVIIINVIRLHRDGSKP